MRRIVNPALMLVVHLDAATTEADGPARDTAEESGARSPSETPDGGGATSGAE